MIINTDYKIDNKVISYEIVDDGYLLYSGNLLWIKQLEPYAKLFVPDGTYEENCLAQIQEIVSSSKQTDDGIREWSETKRYETNSYCTFNGQLFQCLVTNSGIEPTENVYWTLISLAKLQSEIAELQTK